MFVVKDSIDLISEPLTLLTLLTCLSLRAIVPGQMKIARVIPLFKPGDHRSIPNYRPISVLSIFSKLLERAVYNRVINYINKSNVIFDNQYGFRKKHSTSLALMHLYDKITSISH